ncbi:hypothetical protein ACFO4O_13930 [Glaciecola siphonariae]|uniref:Peptidase MA-like domain-containing protein n=1 Tax=Glaciecola siphonariae TaxID=521012 RepID=A0ABV9M0N8_9ALTE
MKKSSYLYLTLSVILIGTPLYFFKGAIACEAAGPLGYEQVAPNVFIATSDNRNKDDLAFLAHARSRVSDTFGEMTARPTIILTLNKDESDKFFASTTASSHFSPFNNCLVLGPKGQNVDVAAHELVHAEIYERLGWLTQMLKMPRWFEEGISLTVDFREPFLPENISMDEAEVEAVKALFFGHQFYNENAFKNYQAARLAVDSVDKRKFYAKLDRIKQGESFDALFSTED